MATNAGGKNCGGRGFAPSVPWNARLCFFPLLTLTQVASESGLTKSQGQKRRTVVSALVVQVRSGGFHRIRGMDGGRCRI